MLLPVWDVIRPASEKAVSVTQCESGGRRERGKKNHKKTNADGASLLAAHTCSSQAQSEIIISPEEAVEEAAGSSERIQTSASLSDPCNRAGGKPATLITNKNQLSLLP